MGDVCKGISCEVFPYIGEAEDEQEVLGTTTWGSTVDAYAAEFLRLDRFASIMVAEKE